MNKHTALGSAFSFLIFTSGISLYSNDALIKEIVHEAFEAGREDEKAKYILATLHDRDGTAYKVTVLSRNADKLERAFGNNVAAGKGARKVPLLSGRNAAFVYVGIGVACVGIGEMIRRTLVSQ